MEHDGLMKAMQLRPQESCNARSLPAMTERLPKFAAIAAALAFWSAPPALAEGDSTASFGVISPEMQDCWADPAGAGCPDANPQGADYRSSPIRIGGEATMGFLYDDGKISPTHSVKITFEFGGETDGGLQFRGKLPLSEPGDGN